MSARSQRNALFDLFLKPDVEAGQVRDELVLAFREDVNGIDDGGRTLLHAAHRADVCSELLACSKFTLINSTDHNGRSALFEAAWRGRSDVCLAILGHSGFHAVNARNSDRRHAGHTALHYACEKQLTDVVRAILAHPSFDGGNQQGCGGWTALHDAARAGNVEICSLLLEHPKFTSEQAEDRHGRTALACCRDHQTRELLLQRSGLPERRLGQATGFPSRSHRDTGSRQGEEELRRWMVIDERHWSSVAKRSYYGGALKHVEPKYMNI